MAEHILVGKQSEQLRALYRDYLKGLGYDVTLAATADELMRKIIYAELGSGPRFDLIITGTRMPDLLKENQGPKLIESVCLNAHGTPVIIATAEPLGEHRAQGVIREDSTELLTQIAAVVREVLDAGKK